VMQLSLFDFVGKILKRRSNVRAPRRRRRVPSRACADPRLQQLWIAIRARHFPHRPDIDQYVVAWSRRRQKRTLASCCPQRKQVSVARELNYPQHQIWLEPLLYHEMCHACLADLKKGWHGKEFKALERIHPHTHELNDWIKRGGWSGAVRSDRARRAHAARSAAALPAQH
jgi:hypothetical protein